jgi:Protein of unknown function (DUF4054)
MSLVEPDGPFPAPFAPSFMDTVNFWPVDEKQFRKDFPEFADTTVYTQMTVCYWLAFSQMSNNPSAWGTWLPLGIELLAAHYITEEAQALKTALAGGNPGTAGASGPIASKNVSQVAISYAVQAALETGPAGSGGAGMYNATIYGRRWWHLAQLVGAGSVQL